MILMDTVIITSRSGNCQPNALSLVDKEMDSDVLPEIPWVSHEQLTFAFAVIHEKSARRLAFVGIRRVLVDNVITELFFDSLCYVFVRPDI
jgi:hypothetical protein